VKISELKRKTKEKSFMRRTICVCMPTVMSKTDSVLYLNFIKRAKILIIVNKIILAPKLVRIKEMKQSPGIL